MHSIVSSRKTYQLSRCTRDEKKDYSALVILKFSLPYFTSCYVICPIFHNLHEESSKSRCVGIKNGGKGGKLKMGWDAPSYSPCSRSSSVIYRASRVLVTSNSALNKLIRSGEVLDFKRAQYIEDWYHLCILIPFPSSVPSHSFSFVFPSFPSLTLSLRLSRTKGRG